MRDMHFENFAYDVVSVDEKRGNRGKYGKI